jgi:transaldolase
LSPNSLKGVEMRVAIASDHAGVGLQQVTVEAVRQAGHEPVVIGQATEGDDYPDVALAVGGAIRTGQAQRGVVLCGSGAGVTVAANKIPLVRAALAYETYTARQMVEHDDVNVLALGARVIGPAVAADVVAAFAGAEFSGAARHVRRLGKVLAMEATRVQGAAAEVVARGQRLWLDGLEASALDDGRLAHWIGDYAVSGATTAPDRLVDALRTGAYRDRMTAHRAAGVTEPEALALSLALDDVVATADLLRGIHAASVGADGYVSFDLPPALIDDIDATMEVARRMYVNAGRPNVMVKVPGTRAGQAVTRRLVAEGIPVHVTLVFSVEQFRAAADAYLDGIEHRVRAGQDPRVGSVVALDVAPWDQATVERLPAELHGTVGLVAAHLVVRALDEMLESQRWRQLADAGAIPPRLSASTAAQPPLAPTYYVDALDIADVTLLVSKATLEALNDHGGVGAVDAANGTGLQQLTDAGINLDVLATRLHHDGLRRAAARWTELLDVVARASVTDDPNAGPDDRR